MSVLVFLILASLGLAGAALLAFVWAVKTGQFEDTCTPSLRLLADEAAPVAKIAVCREASQLAESKESIL